jgi:hypothetical protein
MYLPYVLESTQKVTFGTAGKHTQSVCLSGKSLY